MPTAPGVVPTTPQIVTMNQYKEEVQGTTKKGRRVLFSLPVVLARTVWYPGPRIRRHVLSPSNLLLDGGLEAVVVLDAGAQGLGLVGGHGVRDQPALAVG